MTESSNTNKSNERIEGLRRRDLIKGMAAAGLSVAAGAHPLVGAAEDSVSPNLIQRENAKPGTRDWLLTNTYIDPDMRKDCHRLQATFCPQIEPSRKALIRVYSE